jgi:ADP-ribose pyrophosphatase YjhB (NUDIX family)
MKISGDTEQAFRKNIIKRTVLTLSFLLFKEEIILALKKGGFGSGRWNGYGGKIKEIDNGRVLDAANREILEESKMKVKKIEPFGVIKFYFQSKPGEEIECHVSKILEYEGEPQETEEMGKPQRYPFDKIPYKYMWAADNFWLPLFLKGKKFRGWFLYTTPEENKVIDYGFEDP